MKFKLDENLPEDAAVPLRTAGHDVETITSEGLNGSPDLRVAAVCRSEGRALITLDTDFGNMRAYPPADHPGLIVLRPPRQDRATVVRMVSRLVNLLEQEALDQRLWIVDEQRLRIRG